MSYGMFNREDLYGSQGKMMTKSLFREWVGDSAPLSFGKHETEGCINLRSVYLSYCVDDPTETLFAEAVFGDVLFWENLKSTSWLKPLVEEWAHVATVRRKAKAFATLIADATDQQSRSKVSSAKYLIEEPWKDKRKATTKKEVQETTSQAFKEVAEDAKRIFQ